MTPLGLEYQTRTEVKALPDLTVKRKESAQKRLSLTHIHSLQEEADARVQEQYGDRVNTYTPSAEYRQNFWEITIGENTFVCPERILNIDGNSLTVLVGPDGSLYKVKTTRTPSMDTPHWYEKQVFLSGIKTKDGKSVPLIKGAKDDKVDVSNNLFANHEDIPTMDTRLACSGKTNIAKSEIFLRELSLYPDSNLDVLITADQNFYKTFISRK
jgi:hypothetical protein